MAKSRKLEILVTGDARGAQKALGSLGTDADKFQSKMGRVGKQMAVGLGVGLAGAGVAFGKFVADGFGALVNLERINAQTANVIESTGKAAGISAKGVAEYAQALEKKTGIEQESIQEGQNLLLTFTDIQNKVGKGNDIFNQATAIMTDMSVALGTDAKSSAIQLGKALNDPTKGIAALTRVGVTFTQQQKDQIKSLQASGDKMGAQKVILAELNKEFGGSAAAFGDTTAGKVEKLKNAFGDIQEEIAGKLMPVAIVLLNWAQKELPGAFESVKAVIADLTPTFKTVGAAVMGFVKTVGPIAKAFGKLLVDTKLLAPLLLTLVSGFAAFKTAKVAIAGFAAAQKVATVAQLAFNVALSANPIGLVVIAIAALVAGLVWAYKNIDGFREFVDGAFKAIKNVVSTAVEFIGKVISVGFQAIANAIRSYVNLYLSVIRTAWNAIKSAVTAAMRAISAVISTYINTYRSIISAGFNAIRSTVTAVMRAISSFIRSAWSAISSAISSTVGRIRSIVSSGFNAVRNAIVGPISAAKNTVSGIINSIKNMFGALPGAIRSVMSGLASAVSAPFRAAGSAIKKAWNATVGGFTIRVPKLDLGFLGSIGGQSWTIPELHTGGMVTGPAGSDQLRMLQAGEMVLSRKQVATMDRGVTMPSQTMPAMTSGRSGQTVQVVVNVQGSVVTERQLVQVVRDGLIDTGRRTGRPVLAGL